MLLRTGVEHRPCQWGSSGTRGWTTDRKEKGKGSAARQGRREARFGRCYKNVRLSTSMVGSLLPRGGKPVLLQLVRHLPGRPSEDLRGPRDHPAGGRQRRF